MYKWCTTEKAALQQRRIEECLLAAMQEKPYHEISVSGLCEQTDLSRKTFYRLFDSKQDALCSLVDRTIREYVNFRLPQGVEDNGSFPELLGFYYYWLEQRGVLDALSKNGLSTMLFDRSIRHVMEEDTDILLQLGAGPDRGQGSESVIFYLSGLLTLVIAWHHGGYQKTPEEMAAVTAKLLSEPPMRS